MIDLPNLYTSGSSTLTTPAAICLILAVGSSQGQINENSGIKACMIDGGVEQTPNTGIRRSSLD